MAEVELQCAVYGEATVFPVKVALDAPVSALQEVIANKYRVVSNRVQVYAATLTLYLARKTGETEWVKHTHAFEDFLRGGVSTEYEKMLSSWALDDSELFGSTFAPRRREVHVLVQLPDLARFAPVAQASVAAAVPLLPESSSSVKRKTEGHDDAPLKKRVHYNEWFDGRLLEKKTQPFKIKGKPQTVRYLEMRSFPPCVHQRKRFPQVLERDSYVDIFKSLKADVTSFLRGSDDANITVTGNPGIGKSRFYLYCAAKFVELFDTLDFAHAALLLNSQDDIALGHKNSCL